MKILYIVHNTFRECTRSKALYTSLVFSLVLLLFAKLLGEWAIFFREKMLQAFSLTVMTFSSVFLGIYCAITLFHSEFQRKTIGGVLSHAVSRWQFILGKYLGLQIVLLLNLLVLGLGSTLIQTLSGVSVPDGYSVCIYFIFLEAALIASAALFFATFTSPFLSAWFSIAVYLMGYWVNGIAEQIILLNGESYGLQDALHLPDWSLFVARGVQWILPNLDRLNYKTQVLYGGGISWTTIGASTGYALCYVVLFCGGAMLWFQKRELSVKD